MASGFSARLPLAYDKEDGPYGLTKTLAETVKQNFKNLVMTVPGERIMDPEFGVGFYQLLFENHSAEVIEDMQERLYNQVAKYMPFVKIQDLNTGFLDHTLSVQITYFIEPLKVSDAISIDITQK